jgi:hypothetical protein
MEKKDITKKYLLNINENDKLKRSKDKLVGEIKARDLETAKYLLYSSLVFNDHTFVTALGDGNLSVVLLDKDGINNYLRTKEIIFHIPLVELQRLNIKKENVRCSPGFVAGASTEFHSFINELEPFLESKRVIYEPERIVLLSDASAQSPKRHHALNILPESPWDTWHALEESKAKTSLPLVKFSSSFPNEKLLFDITVPFIQGLPFKKLHAIIEDEQDSVLIFRKKLKEVVATVENNKKTVSELINDEIYPQIAVLNKRFDKILQSSAVRVGGASLGSISLSLFSICFPESISLVTTLLGAGGGVGLMTREYANYIEKRHEFKEDPFYFLWKLRRL